MRKKAKNPIVNGHISVALDFRVRKGMSQRQVAAATRLRPMDISRIERGCNMGMVKFYAVAGYLGLSLDALIRNDLTAAAKCISAPPMVCRTMQEHIRAQEKENDCTGNAGEDWVYQRECEKLADIGLDNMVNPNYANDPDAHFDLLSYDRDTLEPVYIEVKATRGNGNAPIFLTDGEYQLLLHCRQHGYRYELHRVVYAMDPAKRRDIVYSAEKLLDCYTFSADRFRGVRKEVS